MCGILVYLAQMEGNMANVTLDAETLYYQYMINHNPTSTMLNAISGNSSDDSSLGLIGSLGTLNSLGALDSLGISGLSGISGALGSLDSSSSVSFANILDRYLSAAKTTAYTDSIEAAEMADKLSSVLEEAAQTEDTSSLTYKTVQELYEYFSERVSAKAASLMGSTTGQTSTASASSATSSTASAEQMNQAAMSGQEFDFPEMDEMVDAVFEEQMPLS